MKSLLHYIFCLFLYLSSAIVAQAQWERVITGDASFDTPDHPSPHPLSYFTRRPFLRGFENSLCDDSETPQGTAECARDFSAKVSVRSVGTLSGFHIVELLYTFTPTDNVTDKIPQMWKSILVKTGTDSYREIYHLQSYAAPSIPDHSKLEPSRIVHVGTETVLATRDSDGGNGGGCYEAYWWFSPDGPQPLDFSSFTTAIRKRVPRDATFTSSCWALDLDRSELKSWVQKRDAKCHGCGGLGEVIAHFKLNGASVEATDIHFRSNPD